MFYISRSKSTFTGLPHAEIGRRNLAAASHDLQSDGFGGYWRAPASAQKRELKAEVRQQIIREQFPIDAQLEA